MRIDDILGEALTIHDLAHGQQQRRERVGELLRAVGLDASYGSRFPHQVSGGQRQRIGIARALAVEPKLVICDEPVSSLDVSVQAQIVNLFQDLQAERGIAFLFIAHDLAVVEHVSRRVAVMYLGRIVELAEAKTLVRQPLHPYTKALVASVPRLGTQRKLERQNLSGDVPSPVHVPPGCPFHPRCPTAEARCREQRPELREFALGQSVACHLAGCRG